MRWGTRARTSSPSGRRSRLDGCYALKTDLSRQAADKETVRERYKDLALVEWGFRTCKTAHLEVRPIYLRRAERARALVVMPAYIIVQELRKRWAALDATVQEGIKELDGLRATEVVVNGKTLCTRVPEPRESARRLLESAGVSLPDVLPHRGAKAATKRKLPERRKER